MKIHSNSCLKWIVNSVKNATRCNMASKWPLKNINKTSVILLICSKRPQNCIIQILAFLIYLSKVVKWAPKGSRGAPGDPTGGLR